MKMLMEMGGTYKKFFQALPFQLQKAGSNVSHEVIQDLFVAFLFESMGTLKGYSQQWTQKTYFWHEY